MEAVSLVIEGLVWGEFCLELGSLVDMLTQFPESISMVGFDSYSLVLTWRFHLVTRASENVNTTDLQVAPVGRKTYCPEVHSTQPREYFSTLT